MEAEIVDRHQMSTVFAAQRENRLALKTTTPKQRVGRLRSLRDEILRRAEEIDAALHSDLRKMKAGVDNPEIRSVIYDIDDAIAGLAQWMAPTLVKPSAHLRGNTTHIRYEPRGVVLLLGPWNFPFALIFSPLVPIIAAGNACIIKPSEMQPKVSGIVHEIISAVFKENEVACFEGGIATAEALQDLPFDQVFFTGSPAVGKRVMAAAARHLSSVTLELGGKCPAIIDSHYSLEDAAKKSAAPASLTLGNFAWPWITYEFHARVWRN